MSENLKKTNFWSNSLKYGVVRVAQEYFKEERRVSLRGTTECESGCNNSCGTACATGCTSD